MTLVLYDVFVNILAAVIFAVLGFFGGKFVVPTIVGLLRRVPKLNGTTWRKVLPDGTDDPLPVIFKIKQFGTRIDATVTRTERYGERVYRYVGHLSGEEIVLTWEDIASPERQIGAMVLHLSPGLRQLSGLSSYFKQSAGEVVATPQRFRRLAG